MDSLNIYIALRNQDKSRRLLKKLLVQYQQDKNILKLKSLYEDAFKTTL